MKDDKTLKLLSISLSLLVVLSACILTNSSSLQTSIPISPIPSMTLQSSAARIETNTVISTSTVPALTASSTATSTSTVTTTATSTSTAISIPPVSLNWKAYSYTCDYAAGGTTMTMDLSWSDHSNSEDGFRIYRDNVVIATLPPNTTSYVDVTFIATGNTVSYSVEAFNQDWQVSSSTIVYACQ